MDPIAAAHGTTLEAVAIAWLRQQKVVTSPIVGVKSVEQLEANLKSVDVTLNDDDKDPERNRDACDGVSGLDARAVGTSCAIAGQGQAA